MNKMKFGEINFNTLVGYLFWINTEFRSTLPGKPPKEDILVETMGSVRNKLWQRLEGNNSAWDPLTSESVRVLDQSVLGRFGSNENLSIREANGVWTP